MNSTTQDTSWHRTLVPSLAGLLVLLAGVGFGFGLTFLESAAGNCYELAILACIGFSALVAGSLAIIIEFVIVWRLLRKSKVSHPVAIPLLVNCAMLAVFLTTETFLTEISPWVTGTVYSLLFVLLCIFHDGLFNVVKGRLDFKIAVEAIILVAGIVAASIVSGLV